jgi:YHS domain-containing protein
MADTTGLMNRIDAEFESVNERIKQFQAEKTHEFEDRQQRLDQFAALCERLQSVWRPRLEALSQRFKDKVEVVPSIKKSQRSATIKFHSNLATFNLTFTAMTDAEIRNLVVDYTLDILPILMTFEKNKQIQFPIDQVDSDALGNWMDDRIVDAVKVYLELHQNAYYLKGHLVRDPITEIEFPRYAAAATLQANGKTYYFISEEACEAFKRENQVSS